MPISTPKSTSMLILLLVVLGLMQPARRMLGSNDAAVQPLVSGISIHDGPGGAIVIEISVTHPVPYQTMQLSAPERLVVDLKGAHAANLRGEYPAHSQVLERVRTGQWKSEPAVFRVVADLKGNPSFSVKNQDSVIRIELKPRAAAAGRDDAPGASRAESKTSAGAFESATAQEDALPVKFFQMNRFKDLSASLTAPVLPPHDRLIPVATPDPPTASQKDASSFALVSGVSIEPDSNGETTIDVASSRSVPYRIFQLADPFRLVIDLKDARNTSSQEVYRVNSAVLKRVRVGQWRQDGPPVVRVVADLEGYPIFDVHAQQPGIRIELRPRKTLPPVVRNPFEFKTAPRNAKTDHPGTPSNQTPASPANLAGAAAASEFSGLKVIGFIEKKETGTQAVISDHSNIYVVPKGGMFEKTFTVLAISADAVQVQDTNTRQTSWITYVPQR